MADNKLSYPKWVPVDARKRLDELYSVGPSSMRPLLERLSGRDYLGMKDIWEGLPQKGKEDWVIDMILFAYRKAQDLRPRMPRHKKDSAEYINKHRLVDVQFSHIALCAEMLSKDMRELEGNARLAWGKSWKGDTNITFDDVIAVIQHIEPFYKKLEVDFQELQIWAKNNDFPSQPRKRSGADEQQTHFIRLVAWFFYKNFKRYLDEINAGITTVVFDLKQSISKETVYGARRSAKEHLVKKRT